MSTNPSTLFVPPLAIDFEELDKKIRQDRLDREQRMAAHRGAFSAISLKAWIERVAQSGIAFVPALQIGELDADAWLAFEKPNEQQAQHLRDVSALVRLFNSSEATRHHMLRWDFCAPMEVKACMADGISLSPEPAQFAREVHPMDDRAIGILIQDHVGQTVPILSRPWIQAAVDQDYPVEFRVFVRDSRIQGVANYYPQRTLPQSEFVLKAASLCESRAQKLISYLRASKAYPWMDAYEGNLASGEIHASIDFLIAPDGEALFLEAGPAYGFGAHPCSFIDRPIDGLALGLAPGVKLR